MRPKESTIDKTYDSSEFINNLRWYKHLKKDDKLIKDLRFKIWNCEFVLSRLRDVLVELEAEYTKPLNKVTDNPNWERQAAEAVGVKRVIDTIKLLLPPTSTKE